MLFVNILCCTFNVNALWLLGVCSVVITVINALGAGTGAQRTARTKSARIRGCAYLVEKHAASAF